MVDAFEKLAGLVGASVEAAPSQGLPRTWTEAKVLGLQKYFTGKPCKHGHVAERYVFGGCVECIRQRAATPEYKEHGRRYRALPENKERERQRNATPEAKERERQSQLKQTGDATLFAINQAERAAVSARAPADIVPKCPEPHRSQLQALIDRIRADPTAGKAVVGLLRTMRELRKLELAEQNTKDDTTASST